MKTAKGYYSLVQYCPDLSRLEAANVGVILFCPELRYIRARIAQGNDRIRRFFGSEDVDWVRVNSTKTAIEKRLEVEAEFFKVLEDFENFVSTRANEIQISPPRPMKVTDPNKDLTELFDKLVGGRVRREEKDAATPVKRALAEAFKKENVEAYIRKDISVRVPAFHEDLEVPFGFQNGRFNLIQPVQFEQSTHVGVIEAACKYAVEGSSLYKHRDEKLGNLQLIVVGGFSRQSAEYTEVVSDIFEENDVRLFSHESIVRLTAEIRSTGKLLEQAAP